MKPSDILLTQLARLIPLPKNNSMRFLTLALLLLAAISCKNKAADNNTPFADEAEAADTLKSTGSPYVFTDTVLVSIAAKDFYLVTKAKPNMPILDLRPEAQYKIGHVWRSVSMDANDKDFMRRLSGFGRNQEYAVYCQNGDVSFKVAEEMKRMGFLRIYHLQHGLSRWAESEQALQLK